MGNNSSYNDYKNDFENQAIYDREKKAFKETEELRKEALKRLNSVTIENRLI